jgi:hypothetical protein
MSKASLSQAFEIKLKSYLLFLSQHMNIGYSIYTLDHPAPPRIRGFPSCTTYISTKNSGFANINSRR